MKSSPITNRHDYNYCVTCWLADLPAGEWVDIFPGNSGVDAAKRITRGVIVEHASIVLITAFNAGTESFAQLRHSAGAMATITELDVMSATPAVDGFSYGRIDRIIDGDTEKLQLQRTESGSAATTGKLCVFLKLIDLNPLVKTV